MENTFGQYIRTLREKGDLSLREFAKKIDCSAAFVSDIELGRRYPSEPVLATIAKILGVTVDELKKYDTRPPVDDMKRLTEANPQYALAFRQVIDKKVSPEELMKLAKKEREHKSKK